jgi:hypothetical protein
MSPTTKNVFEAVQITEAADHRALNFGAVAVAPVELMVTPAPCAKVTWPAPNCATLIVSLAEYTEGGTVSVIPEALSKVTRSLRSPATRVYVVPV